MEKEKFVYRFEFKFGDDDHVIAYGTTTSSLVAKLSEIQQKLLKFGNNSSVVNCYFDNEKIMKQNETKTH